MDGYMDTMDALHSYQSRERKLEILKDAHIGAFSVICLLCYYLIYVGAYLQIQGAHALFLLGTGYWFSRILSAIGVTCFQTAKKDGLVHTFSDQSDKRKVKIMLSVQFIICAILFLSVSVIAGALLLLSGTLTLVYYYLKCRKEFEGITGDTAGWFLTLCEGVIILIIAGASVLGFIS